MKRVKFVAMIVAVLSGGALLGGFLFPAFHGAFTVPEAGAIGIIGGADGPTAIYTTSRLASKAMALVVIFAGSLAAWLGLLFQTRK